MDPCEEPSWSGIPNHQYSFEIIKNGVFIDKVLITKPYTVIGKLSTCDIILEHPSISRHHCIVQYRSEGTKDEPCGLYVYDLESTHGTFQNKYRLQPKVYNRVRVGHIIKFGGSTRMFILQGPDEDQEPETVESVTELKVLANEKKLKLEKLDDLKVDENKIISLKESSEQSSVDGIDWGMGEDAVEEEEEWKNIENPFAVKEDLYLDDPKKTLRGWFEREGHNLPQYHVEEIKCGYFKAKVELPSVGASGKPLSCVVEHKGKKKDAVVQCALEACRALDRLGLLRQSTHESHERKRRDWTENDYYDSDEDEFLDRTGDIERKRLQRKREVESQRGPYQGAESYDSLSKQYTEVTNALDKLEMDLKRFETLKEKRKMLLDEPDVFDDVDELEAYMKHLDSQTPDKHKLTEWKLEAVRLKTQEGTLRKLVNLARPVGLPELRERQFSDALKKLLYMAVQVGVPELRKSLCADGSDPKSSKEPSQNGANTKRKVPSIRRVHEAFMEEEEETKPKLRKVNCNDDDDDDIKPCPYAKPQRALDKYREIARRDRQQKRMEEGLKAIGRAIYQNFTPPDSQTESLERELAETRTKDTGNDISCGKSDTIVGISSVIQDSDTEKSEEPELSSTSERIIEPSTSERIVVGPCLPSESSNEFTAPLSPVVLKKKGKTKGVQKSSESNPFAFEKKYETWVPPAGQTGDGRTALNDKLGY